MIRFSALAVLAIAFLVVADRAAGTVWALPVAAVAVGLIFGCDRLTVWRNRPPVVSFDRKRVGE